MRSVEQSIQALSRAVQSEARAEAEQIVADAKAKAEAVRQHAQEQAAAERAEILARASGEAERIRSQALATTQLKARTMQLERREKLLDRVFEAARQQLPTVQQGTDYDQVVHHLLREALIHLGADAAQVRADERTRMLLTDQVLTEVSKEVGGQVQLGTSLTEGTGVIVETAEGHRQYDNTLEARLSRLQEELRSPVYRLLLGESL
ncbi:MAG: V-type ATP synthase subunit E [Anaerolineae bacterium]|jgi:vacuolar-type H+-ATPase subunit E/Vma4